MKDIEYKENIEPLEKVYDNIEMKYDKSVVFFGLQMVHINNYKLNGE